MPTEEELARLPASVVRSYKAQLPPPVPADWDGVCRRDMGPEVVRYLYDKMAIDDEWAVWEERGFSWWGHRLRQSVRALKPVREDEFLLTRVVVWTDFLRDVPDRPRTYEALDVLNGMTLMHAYVWNRARRTIQLVSVGVVNEETAHWSARQMAGLMALQGQIAHEEVERWAKVIGARPAWSHHPRQGPRPKPDDMLHVIEGVFARHSDKPSLFRTEEFEATVAGLHSYAIPSACGPDAMTAEFPFFGKTPAALSVTEHILYGKPLSPQETALAELGNSSPHPRLGSGLLVLLQLPLNIREDPAWGRRFAAHLNRRWRARRFVYTRWGAWCTSPRTDSVAYAMFVPNFLWAPGLTTWIAWNLFHQSRMARDELNNYVLGDCPPGSVIRSIHWAAFYGK